VVERGERHRAVALGLCIAAAGAIGVATWQILDRRLVVGGAWALAAATGESPKGPREASHREPQCEVVRRFGVVWGSRRVYIGVDTMNAWLAFLSGIGVALVGAITAVAGDQWIARRRRRNAARFQVYMQLLGIYSWYWWVTVKEMHQEEVDPDLRRRLRDGSWKVLDLLRETDDVEDLDQIVEVLLSESFESSSARYKAMDELLEKLGRRVNPRFVKAIGRVANENRRRLFQDERPKYGAPGTLSLP